MVSRFEPSLLLKKPCSVLSYVWLNMKLPLLVCKTKFSGTDRCCRMLSSPREALPRQRTINIHYVRRPVAFDPSDDQAAADPRIPRRTGPNPEETAICLRYSRGFDDEIDGFAAYIDRRANASRLGGFDGDDLALCGGLARAKYTRVDVTLQRIFVTAGSDVGSLLLFGGHVYSGLFR